MTTTHSQANELVATALVRPVSDQYTTVHIARRAVVGGLVLVIAIVLRCWGIGAIFESSDQVSMAYLVRHSYGLKWLFAHDYGPVFPLLQRSFAEVLSRFGLPMGEASYRLLTMLVSLAQVLLTFPLLRRLRCSLGEALAGMFCCAILPNLVIDGHYTWGFVTVWLFAGSLALWATLAYLDNRRTWQLLVAAGALSIHCLSNLYSFALPITLLAVWLSRWLAYRNGDNRYKPPMISRSLAIGFVLPCVVALAAILICWQWTGVGQIGHLFAKHRMGTTGLQLDQIARLPATWIRQFGYLYGTVAAAGLVFGLITAAKGERRGLLGIWCLVELLPLVLLADWDRIGNIGPYFIQVVFTGGLLGTMLIWWAYRRLSGYRWARAGVVVASVLAFSHMTIAGADECLAGGGLKKYTGIDAGNWGNIMPDTGIKAAGWYVRTHVPIDVIIMPLHSNKGMEVSVAEFYLGRKVLACCDLAEALLPSLLEAMRADVDVLIIEEHHRSLVEGLPEFERICTFRNGDRIVRYIYTRANLSLPRLDEEVSIINKRYDRQYTPDHIPIPLPAAPGFKSCLAKYQAVVKQLRARR